MLGTFYGTGVQLLAYEPLGEGRFAAQQWVTVLFVPIIPLGTWIVEPLTLQPQNLGAVAGGTFEFRVHGKSRTTLRRILEVYAATIVLLVIALTPAVVLFSVLPSGPQPWFVVMIELICVVWPIVVLAWVNNRHERHFELLRG